MRLLAFVVLVCTFVLTFAAPAFADAPPPAAGTDVARAAELKKRGDELMADLQYRDALDTYVKAYALNPDPALLYNRARAHQALSEYPQALDLLESFVQTAPAELKARVPALDELIADVRARVAVVAVRCDVDGARVFVRDKLEATLPAAQPIRVRAGAAKIEVRAEGYLPYVKEIDLPGAKTTTIDASLLREVPEGSAILAITTTPSSVNVFVDGRPLGTSPVEATVPAGRHAVRVEADGYEDSRVDVEIVNGQRRTMSVTMNKKGSILGRWWFWTGVGVVVVSSIVVVYALTTTSDPPSGSIPPGQVRGPLTVGF